jgi:hypothetical protein
MRSSFVALGRTGKERHASSVSFPEKANEATTACGSRFLYCGCAQLSNNWIQSVVSTTIENTPPL